MMFQLCKTLVPFGTAFLCCVFSFVALEESVGATLFADVSAIATSQWSDNMIDKIVNGDGLDEYTSLGVHTTAGGSAGMWHAGPRDAGIPGGTGTGTPIVAEQEIIFDLGSNVDVESIHIWNMNQHNSTRRGVKDFDLYVSDNDDHNTWTFVAALVLDEADGQDGLEAQLMAVDPVELQNVRLVRFDILTAHSGNATEYVGLSEVGFVVVPEPSVLIGMFVLLPMLLVLRRGQNACRNR